MPRKRKRDTNLRIHANDAKGEKNIGSPPTDGENQGNGRGDGKKARPRRNEQKDRLEILIVNGKMTVQDYSEEHDSEKLIEMLEAIGIKSRVKSDGPCG